MNRKGFAPIVIILLIVGIMAIGGIWYYAMHGSAINAPSSNQSSARYSSSSPTFFEPVDVLAGVKAPGTSTLINIGSDVSLKDITESNKNDYSADVCVGNLYFFLKKIDFQTFSPSILSPSGGHVATRFINMVATSSDDRTFINIINLLNTNNIKKYIIPTSTIVGSPQQAKDYQGPKGNFTVVPYIASVAWNGENALDVMFYFITNIYNSQAGTSTAYRISPKQIWRYDMNTQKYSLVETLPELIQPTSTPARFSVYPFISAGFFTDQGPYINAQLNGKYSIQSSDFLNGVPWWNLHGSTTNPYGVIAQLNFYGGIVSDATSPGGRYGVFEVRNQLSSSSVELDLLLVDLDTGDHSFIPYPVGLFDGEGIPFYESYAWNSDDTLNLVFYFIHGAGNNDYYRIATPELWQFNIKNSQFTDLGATQSQQSTFSLSCGNELPSQNQSNLLAAGTVQKIPVYQLSPVKLIGINPNNAAYNRDIDQETLCDGFAIEQEGGKITFSNQSGTVLYQGGGSDGGMYLDNLSVFQNNAEDYFISGGGDCGNKYCSYWYSLFSVDASGHVTPITGKVSENNKIFLTPYLWSTENPTGENVYTDGSSLYIITGDGDYPEAIVINASDTYIMTVSGGATSTNPQNSVPSDIQKLLLMSRG